MPGTTTDPRLGHRFVEAVDYAHELHHDQIRKGTSGTPYLAHLLSTAALVLEDGGDEDEAIAALLHDALEDQHQRTSFDAIEQRFGRHVADTVLACSDPAPGKDEEWDVRKGRYLDDIAKKSPSALRVSNADKRHNARSIIRDLRELGDELWERSSQPVDKQLWYYRSLAMRFSRHNAGALADELVRTVRQIETIAGPNESAELVHAEALEETVARWTDELETSSS